MNYPEILEWVGPYKRIIEYFETHEDEPITLDVLYSKVINKGQKVITLDEFIDKLHYDLINKLNEFNFGNKCLIEIKTGLVLTENEETIKEGVIIIMEKLHDQFSKLLVPYIDMPNGG